MVQPSNDPTLSSSCCDSLSGTLIPKPAEPEPIGLGITSPAGMSSGGGLHDPISDGALRRADRGCVVMLRSSGDHWHGAGDLLRGGDDAFPACRRDPDLRLPAVRDEAARPDS